MAVDSPSEKRKNGQPVASNSTGQTKEKKRAAAIALRLTLDKIATSKELNAKQRRSAKRKAEAVATEESGCPASELLVWYDENCAGDNNELPDRGEQNRNVRKAQQTAKVLNTPYVLFVGQLSYTTTKEMLFRHFQKELGSKAATSNTLRIRLLTDKKTKKSRGMAFVETTSPELMYSCLKLHHTHLDGRRINVERSAGGGKNSDARKSKIKDFRTQQHEFISQTVDKILSEYQDKGEIAEKELDDGVILLCKRHSAATVEAALAKYVEGNGRDMNNPSAYLTHLIGKIAVEGIDEPSSFDKKRKRSDREKQSDESSRRPRKRDEKVSGVGQQKKVGTSSSLSKQGVDMSLSQREANSDESNLSRIFPSMTRGRGRGRGYMR